MAVDAENLVWIDMEMTGLDPYRNTVLEIASIITNSDLEILAEGPVAVVHQDDSTLDSMDDWNLHHHKVSGLLDEVRSSKTTVRDAEQQTLSFLRQWVPRGKSPICGNSVGQDRHFIAHHMSELHLFLHYRSIDVSSIKELHRRWWPNERARFVKRSTHRALSDIKGSIEELRYYRRILFRSRPAVEYTKPE